MSEEERHRAIVRDVDARSVTVGDLADEFTEKLAALLPVDVSVVFAVRAPRPKGSVAVFLRHFDDAELRQALRQVARAAYSSGAIDGDAHAAVQAAVNRAEP